MSSLNRYYLIFGAVYIGIAILYAIVQMVLKVNMGGLGIVIPFLSAMITAQRFVKIEQRAPSDDERNQLALISLAIFVIINIAVGFLAFGAMPADMKTLFTDSKALGLMAAFIVFALGIAYFMMRWAYGGLIRKQVDQLLKK